MTAAIAPNRATWSRWGEVLGVVTAPANVKRSVTIALVIGSLFVAMNQLGVILAGQATYVDWLKVGLTYLTPLCVSNLGILSATYHPTAET